MDVVILLLDVCFGDESLGHSERSGETKWRDNLRESTESWYRANREAIYREFNFLSKLVNALPLPSYFWPQLRSIANLLDCIRSLVA